jgi:hypothetical protein
MVVICELNVDCAVYAFGLGCCRGWTFLWVWGLRDGLPLKMVSTVCQIFASFSKLLSGYCSQLQVNAFEKSLPENSSSSCTVSVLQNTIASSLQFFVYFLLQKSFRSWSKLAKDLSFAFSRSSWSAWTSRSFHFKSKLQQDCDCTVSL